MSRCAACNNIMKDNEIKWREDIQQHEDLCLGCRREVYDLSIEDLETLDKLEESVTG